MNYIPPRRSDGTIQHVRQKQPWPPGPSFPHPVHRRWWNSRRVSCGRPGRTRKPLPQRRLHHQSLRHDRRHLDGRHYRARPCPRDDRPTGLEQLSRARRTHLSAGGWARQAVEGAALGVQAEIRPDSPQRRATADLWRQGTRRCRHPPCNSKLRRASRRAIFSTRRRTIRTTRRTATRSSLMWHSTRRRRRPITPASRTTATS